MVTVKMQKFDYGYCPTDYNFKVCGLISDDYSTKGNCIRGINRTMRRLGIKRHVIVDEAGNRTMYANRIED